MRNYLITLVGKAALSILKTRGVLLLVVILGLLGSAVGSPCQVNRRAQQIPTARPAPCCVITAINASTGVVTAKVNANGNIFQFQVTNAALLNSLKIGQGVYANLTTNQVSLDGSTVCCSIVPPPPPAPPAGGAPPPAANKPATSLPAVPAAAPMAVGAIGSKLAPPPPCCNITAIGTTTGAVTAKENTTGKIFQFKVTNATLLNSLKVGQGVYANLSTMQVSLDGTTPCCSIISSSAPPPPLPPAGGTSGNSAVSPPTKTNPPTNAGSTTIQPGLKTLDRLPGLMGTSGPAASGSSSPSGTAPPTNAVCPGPSIQEGVDVSEYQGASIDWNKVRTSGRAFGYARASAGGSYADPSFAQNYAAIKAAGLLRGALHLFDATVDGGVQADYFLSRIGTLQPGDLPPALDIEQQGGVSEAVFQTRVTQWMTRVQAATGRTPIVYSTALVLQQALSSGVSGDSLWIANWSVSCPLLPAGSHQWVYWQYSGSGIVPGIPGAVDVNRFNGTLADLNSLAKSSSSRQQPPTSSGTSSGGTAASNAFPVINEIETDDTGLKQFIELYNPGSSAYDLKGHRVVFRLTTPVTSSDTLLVSFTATTLIPSKGYLLLALPISSGPTPNATYSSPIASAGGVVAIWNGADNTGSLIDAVAYGNAVNPFFSQTAQAPAPPAGSSISRRPDGTNTQNNSMDFKVSATPTPGQPNQ